MGPPSVKDQVGIQARAYPEADRYLVKLWFGKCEFYRHYNEVVVIWIWTATAAQATMQPTGTIFIAGFHLYLDLSSSTLRYADSWAIFWHSVMQTTTRVTRCCSEFLISLFEKPDALAQRLFNQFGHTFVYFCWRSFSKCMPPVSGVSKLRQLRIWDARCIDSNIIHIS